MKRGEIYYIDERPITGSEQQAGRPGIIVSNDKCNASSDVVEVVFTTAQPKKWLPTHVSISATPRPSTALCEQPAPVAITRIGNYIGQVTPAEQANIDTALLIHFDLYIPPQEAPPGGGGITQQASRVEEPTTERLRAERDIFRELYEGLLARFLPAK